MGLFRHPPGYQVKFTNPTTRQPVYGRIIDEVWATDPGEFQEYASDDGTGWREAAFLAQLMDWGDNTLRVRITYYVRPAGSDSVAWKFGGQYAPSMSLEECRAIVEGITERNWLQPNRTNQEIDR